MATLVMISVDMHERCLLVSRNTNVPVIIVDRRGQIQSLEDDALPLGIHYMVRPLISKLQLEHEIVVVTLSDGVLKAGKRSGRQLDTDMIAAIVRRCFLVDVQGIADELLSRAVSADRGRPDDDMSVGVVAISHGGNNGNVRRMYVSYPVRW